MISLDDFASDKLTALEATGLRRTLQVTHRLANGQSLRGDRELISFCCNDYLGLSHHENVISAAEAALGKYGAGSGASRLITGNHPLIDELEGRLARLKGTEDACVFSSGYLTNIGVIPTFIGEEDIIFADELSHACLRAGSDLSRAKIHYFRHNDMAHLDALLRLHRASHPHAMILTDGIFSMDGDLAPLDELAQFAADHDCWLMTDDAHGIGVVGGGRGSGFEFDPVPVIPLQMGTLSKAIGSFGGYVCASRPVIDLIKTRARSLIFTTSLPPASAAAALSALDIIENEPEYCALPLKKAALFCARLNLPAPTSPIVPIIVGDSRRVMDCAAKLEEQGFLVTGIRPPTVAEGTARLRFTFSATHRDTGILKLADAVRGLDILP